jgi:hypothetical protein
MLTRTFSLDMYTKLNASRSYVYAVGRACDLGKISRRDCAGAILYASDRALEVATGRAISYEACSLPVCYWFSFPNFHPCSSDAMQMLGGNGYINDYPTGRIFRDSQLYRVGAGTQEIVIDFCLSSFPLRSHLINSCDLVYRSVGCWSAALSMRNTMKKSNAFRSVWCQRLRRPISSLESQLW